ncbi:MAG: thiamine pyrophosphate-binding protein [Hyphomicrobiaceae bacterium]
MSTPVPHSRSTNTMAGRSAFLEILKSEGVSHLFGNPGTTELPIMHALKDHPDLKFVMAMQESLVVAMADGYSRASGKLVAANVHVAPGLGNALGSLYNAKFTGTPLILTAGQQEQGHGLMEPLLYDPLVPMAQPLVKWSIEVTRLEDLPRILRRAAKVAMTPPTGPVFISLPGDILNAEGPLDLLSSTRIDSVVRPSDAALEALARRLLSAKSPMIIAGDEVVKSDALKEASELAAILGAAAYQQSIAYGAHFLSEHPCYMGALSRIQPQTRAILEAHDLVIALGTDPVRMSVYHPVDAMPEGKAIVQIGLIDWDIGKNHPVEIGIKADVRETLRALIPVIERLSGTALKTTAAARVAGFAAKNWTAKRKGLVTEITGRGALVPIDPDFATLSVIDGMPKDAILVDESLTTGRYVSALYPYRQRFGFHGLASGGIGYSIPAAVGVSLANPGRRVVCTVGDGSAMYSIQALWTAANHKLPITYVIMNNGGYRIIKQRLKAFHQNEHYIGMDFKEPRVDYAGLAAAMGMKATRVTDPKAIKAALAAAHATEGPHLIEMFVDGTV